MDLKIHPYFDLLILKGHPIGEIVLVLIALILGNLRCRNISAALFTCAVRVSIYVLRLALKAASAVTGGVASLCIGGGMGEALVVENV